MITTEYLNVRGQRFRNDSGETIPPFAVLRVKDTEDDGTFVVDKPDEDLKIGQYAVNLFHSVPDNKHGELSFDFPLWIQYDNANEPAVGEEWGPVDGEWTLSLGGVGYTLLSEGKDFSGVKVVRAVRALETRVKLGKTTVAHDKGETEEVAIYEGDTKGTETDTTETEDAYNRFADLATDKWVILMYVDSGWELIAGEC